jgi:hypothetical protein
MEWSDLIGAGADDRLITVVDPLTERDGEDEVAYLARSAADPLALWIKRADIADKFVALDLADAEASRRAELR